ncbi:MAG: hypothetical protein E7256_03020 [Lachnospiraceae bacterium]|nr:hypothetical protein [Lachnospiraceae bacterium]
MVNIVVFNGDTVFVSYIVCQRTEEKYIVAAGKLTYLGVGCTSAGDLIAASVSCGADKIDGRAADCRFCCQIAVPIGKVLISPVAQRLIMPLLHDLLLLYSSVLEKNSIKHTDFPL